MSQTFKPPKQPKDRFTITVEAPESGEAAIRRLRAALKCLGRSFRLRCLSIEPVTKEEPCKTNQ